MSVDVEEASVQSIKEHMNEEVLIADVDEAIVESERSTAWNEKFVKTYTEFLQSGLKKYLDLSIRKTTKFQKRARSFYHTGREVVLREDKFIV